MNYQAGLKRSQILNIAPKTTHLKLKKPFNFLKGLILLVVPVGEVSNYDIEDLHKILEFTGLLEPLTD